MQNVDFAQTGFFFDAILQNEEGKHVLYQDMRDIFDREATSYLKGEKIPGSGNEGLYADEECSSKIKYRKKAWLTFFDNFFQRVGVENLILFYCLF